MCVPDISHNKKLVRLNGHAMLRVPYVSQRVTGVSDMDSGDS